MPRVEATLSAGYQFTAPSVLRKALDLKPGDKIVFDTDKEQITVEKAESHEERVKRAFAELDEWRDGLSDESKELIKKYAGWTVRQYHEYFDNLPETKAYVEEKYGAKVA